MRVVLKAFDRGGLPCKAHPAAQVLEDGLHNAHGRLGHNIYGLWMVHVAEVCRGTTRCVRRWNRCFRAIRSETRACRRSADRRERNSGA